MNNLKKYLTALDNIEDFSLIESIILMNDILNYSSIKQTTKHFNVVIGVKC